MHSPTHPITVTDLIILVHSPMRGNSGPQSRTAGTSKIGTANGTTHSTHTRTYIFLARRDTTSSKPDVNDETEEVSSILQTVASLQL